MADTIILEVERFHPERDTEPSYQSFEVPLRDDWMVLDALNYIKDQLDGSLAFRWSCRMGICGSCGMMVNGVPKLTCETLLMNFAPGPVRVGPLDHFPVVKDLVVEMDDFMAKLQKVRPWIVRKDNFQPRARIYPEAGAAGSLPSVQPVHQLHACYAACPVCGTGSELSSDRRRSRWRIATTSIRATRALRTGYDIVSQHEGIWDCTVVGECSTVCPKGVDPSLAIQQYKLTATEEWFKSFLLPRGNN